MSWFIVALGAVSLLIGVLLFLMPAFMKKKLHFFFDYRWVNVVLVIRLLLGFLLVGIAPATKYPSFFLFLGVIVIFIAITVPFMGSQRINAMSDWWLARSNSILRVWSLVPVALGILLIALALQDEHFNALVLYLSSMFSA